MAKSPESLHEALGEPIQEPLRAGIDFDAMSDDELMAYLQRETTEDKYAVPSYLVPDDMAYQWVRFEVFGKSDFNRPAEVEQRGWRSVPASRHDGRWTPPGTHGPIELDGMRLYELPKRVVRMKRELAARTAQEKVDDMNAQLSYAPIGTGPRVPHKPLQPMARRESGAMPLVIE